MSDHPSSAPPICLSANGKTWSRAAGRAERLLVATTDGIKEFLRPKGAGGWTRGGAFLPGRHISSILYEPRSGVLFAGLHYTGGLMKSEDGGKTWRTANKGFQSEHVYCLTLQHLGDQAVLYAGTEPAMVYRSDDLGESWRAFPSLRDVPDTDKWLFPRSVPHVKNITVHPAEPDTLYACVEQGDLLRSQDGGASWHPLTAFEKATDKFRRDIHRVVPRESRPNEQFLTTGVGLNYTEDGGETWETLTDTEFRIGYPDPLFIHPERDQTLFMAGAGASPNPNWAASGTANPAFMRSDDGGRSWKEAMNGLPSPIRGNIEALAMHASDEGLEFILGTACGEVYSSEDEGANWSLIAADLEPVSKGPHFRHFLSPEERLKVEDELRKLGAFA